MEARRWRWNPRPTLRFDGGRLGIDLPRLGLTARRIPSWDRGAVRVCKPASAQGSLVLTGVISQHAKSAVGASPSGMRPSIHLIRLRVRAGAVLVLVSAYWLVTWCWWASSITLCCSRSHRTCDVRGSWQRSAWCQCVLNASTRRLQLRCEPVPVYTDCDAGATRRTGVGTRK